MSGFHARAQKLIKYTADFTENSQPSTQSIDFYLYTQYQMSIEKTINNIAANLLDRLR